MGVSTDAYLVYGIQLEEGSLSSQGGSGAPEGSPKRLAYTGGDYNGIKLIRHGSDEDPEYIVCLVSPLFRAILGYPEDLHPREMEVPSDADQKILSYCQEHGLKMKGMLGWLLCQALSVERHLKGSTT